MNSNVRRLIFFGVLIGVAVVWWMAVRNRPDEAHITYSQFLQQVRAGNVASVTIVSSNSGASQATCRLKDGKIVRTVLPPDYRDALTTMQDKLVDIEIQQSSLWLPRLMNVTPFLLLLGFWVFMMRRMQNGRGLGKWG